MIVNATEFQNNVGKFLKLAREQEIIITNKGRQIVKLVPLDGEEAPITKSLKGLLKDMGNVDLTRAKEERLAKYGSIT